MGRLDALDEIDENTLGPANESAATRKKRMRSIRIVHVGMFIFGLGFSIVITGVYPYMIQLFPDEPSSKLLNQYGFVVSVNPLGQLLFSPVFGFLANKFRSIRAITFAACVTYVGGNVIYSTLSLFPYDARYYMLLVCRFMVGISTAIAAPFRSYVAGATYQSERTSQLSILASAQSLGFILGPGIQAALTPLQCSDAVDENGGPYFSIDMYTVPGWISVGIGSACFVLFLPGLFKEFNVAEEERILERIKKKRGGIDVEGNRGGLKKPDYWAVAIMVCNYFLYLVNFVILETLGTPLCMDQFGWTESEAVLYIGILLAAGGLITVACFWAVGPLSKRIDERLIMIVGGIIPMIVGRLVFFPFPGVDPPRTPWGTNLTEPLIPYPDSAALHFAPHYSPPAIDLRFTLSPGSNATSTEESSNFESCSNKHFSSLFNIDPSIYGFTKSRRRRSRKNKIDSSSRPSTRDRVECTEEDEEPAYCYHYWCETTPAITTYQFFGGCIIGFIGYPLCLAPTQAIFSKVLGPRPQGLWMGILTSAGSFARFIGPIFVTSIYNEFGPYLTIGIVVISLALSLLSSIIFYRRLVPLKVVDESIGLKELDPADKTDGAKEATTAL